LLPRGRTSEQSKAVLGVVSIGEREGARRKASVKRWGK
jgi:hypothetical protein